MGIIIAAFSLVMIFGAFVLVGIFVVRKSEEVAMKVAGYITAIVFGLMATMAPFALFIAVSEDYVVSYADGGVWVEEGDTLTVIRPIIQAEGRCRVDQDVLKSPTGCWYISEGGQTWMEPMWTEDNKEGGSSVMTLTSLLILLFAILAPAAVLLGAGVWAVMKESGDVTRALGLAAIIGGLLLVILAILVAFLTPAATGTIVS